MIERSRQFCSRYGTSLSHMVMNLAYFVMYLNAFCFLELKGKADLAKNYQSNFVTIWFKLYGICIDNNMSKSIICNIVRFTPLSCVFPHLSFHYEPPRYVKFCFLKTNDSRGFLLFVSKSCENAYATSAVERTLTLNNF